MVLQTVSDIPEEMKKIVEVFYVRGEEAASAEIKKVRMAHPDWQPLIDKMVRLFEQPPESVYTFYDALLAHENDNHDEAFAFDFDVDCDAIPNAFMTATHLSGNRLSAVPAFGQNYTPNHPFVPQPKHFSETDSNAKTKLPSIFTDGSDRQQNDGVNYGLRGRKLTARPHQQDDAFDIDIDLETDGLLFDHADDDIDLDTEINLDVDDTLAGDLTNDEQPKYAQLGLTPIAAPKHDENNDSWLGKRLSEFDNMRMTLPNLQPAVDRMKAKMENTRKTAIGLRAVLDNGDVRVHFEPTKTAMPTVTATPSAREAAMRGLAALNAIQPVSRTPYLLCKINELSQKDLSPKARFLLAMIDGKTSAADLLENSAWPEAETATYLLELQQMALIDFK